MSKERVLQLIDAEDDKMSAGILFGYCAAMSLYDAGFKENVKLDIAKFPRIDAVKVVGSDLHVTATWPEVHRDDELEFPAVTKTVIFKARVVAEAIDNIRHDLDLKDKAIEHDASETKNKKIDRAVAMTYARIRALETRLEALRFAVGGNNREPDNDRLNEYFFAIQSILNGQLLRAYHDLMMWSNLIGGDLQDFVSKTIISRNLRNEHSVSQFLNPHGLYTGNYSSEDTDALRSDIATLAAKLKLNPADFDDKWGGEKKDTEEDE